MSDFNVAERSLRLGKRISNRWLENCFMHFPHKLCEKVQLLVAQIGWTQNCGEIWGVCA